MPARALPCLFTLTALSLCLGSLPAQAQEQTQQREIELVARAQSAKALPDNMLTLSYGHLDRSGEGHKLDSNMWAATLMQRLTQTRAQFWSLGLGGTGVGQDGDTSDGDVYSLSYGQLWASASQPGLMYNLSGFASAGKGEYNNAFTSDKRRNGSVGAIGGLTQAIPFTARDSAQVGANLALSYVFVEGPDDAGAQATLYPFVQYNRVVTRDLNAYARMGATLSTEDASITGESVLFTPKLGVSYALGDYTLGADYSYEFIDDHRGQRVGLSVSRAF